MTPMPTVGMHVYLHGHRWLWHVARIDQHPHGDISYIYLTTRTEHGRVVRTIMVPAEWLSRVRQVVSHYSDITMLPSRRSGYRIRPITRNKARKWMADVHRHLRRPVTGWLFGIQLIDADTGECVGVAMAGRPTSRMLDDGVTVEITRVAVLEGHPNACSRAYGALRRAAFALGYQRAITYTRADERGVSPRAAGFVCAGPAGGGEATRPSRRRAPSEDPSPKIRWVYPANRCQK